MSLRKAAEMALEALEQTPTVNKLFDSESYEKQKDAIDALRQSLAKAEWSNLVDDKPRIAKAAITNAFTTEVTPEVTTKVATQVTGEVTGEVTEEVGACVTCGAPKSEWLVDAVNMSQERVDETVKNRHDPVALFIAVRKINSLQVDSINRLISMAKHAHMIDIKVRINGQDKWYEADWLKHTEQTAPPKREWVGLTDEEYDELMISGDWGGSLIQATEAKLKEKNT